MCTSYAECAEWFDLASSDVKWIHSRHGMHLIIILHMFHNSVKKKTVLNEKCLQIIIRFYLLKKPNIYLLSQIKELTSSGMLGRPPTAITILSATNICWSEKKGKTTKNIHKTHIYAYIIHTYKYMQVCKTFD